MEFLHAAILGVVEGFTEFLPISSTFHMIFVSHLLGIPQTDFQKMFEVVIQSGAILAAALLYARTMLTNKKLFLDVCWAFIPTAIIGLLLYKVIKTVFFTDNMLMITVFGLTGILFLVFEFLIKKDHIKLTKDLGLLTLPQALFIGVCQSAAVLPGVSRAGAVMLGLMTLGVKREEAAKFSFMLAIPTLLAASGLDLIKGKSILLHAGTSGMIQLLIGFLVSFVVAYVVMKWFIGFLQHHTLNFFGIYRLLLIPVLLLVGV